MIKELSPEDVESILNSLPSTDKRLNHIQQVIIPEMDKRSGRSKPLEATEIISKLFNTVGKKGEAIEIFEELDRTRDPKDPELAAEVADIIYYSSQPNTPEYLNNPQQFIESMHFPLAIAYALCILKYTTRINYGDFNNYKDLEFQILKVYLGRLSDSDFKID